jgi:hypothetical protein
MNEQELRAYAASLTKSTDTQLSETQIEAIRERTQAAITQHEAASNPDSRENRAAAELQAWERRGADDYRSLGITPVTDEESAAIKAAGEAAVEKLKAERATGLDDQLHNFRRDWDNGQTDPTSIYFRADPAMRERTEADMMLVRLEAGLPAEPPARRTPAQVAQERFNARHNVASSDEWQAGESRADYLKRTGKVG